MSGLSLDERKELGSDAALPLRGTTVGILPIAVEVALAPGKRACIAEELSIALQSRMLSPAAASMLRGRLGFAQSCMYGKYGRALPSSFQNASILNRGGTRMRRTRYCWRHRRGGFEWREARRRDESLACVAFRFSSTQMRAARAT